MPTNLIEIFSSFQGEGPHLGEPMAFLRFQDCALSCKFCDTPASFEKHADFRVETPPQSARFQSYPNPVDGEFLTRLLQPFSGQILSITGGEPLQQADFLAAWLPDLAWGDPVLLETSGVFPAALAKVIASIDIVSMDMKLPSVTGMRSYWNEHAEFLRIARQKQVYVKVVVSKPTDLDELREAIAIVEREAPGIPFILQPVTPAREVGETIPEARLRELYDFSKQRLADVRVIPQVHPMLGLL
ncbi:MAG: 7-carboxy-7-deazaguanine synthase QueE [Deltaproteobacteria bacterium]|nr:7-carboxy-7-deazaguanine synthase QueE [Deltaproteobacteria bacterium]